MDEALQVENEVDNLLTKQKPITKQPTEKEEIPTFTIEQPEKTIPPDILPEKDDFRTIIKGKLAKHRYLILTLGKNKEVEFYKGNLVFQGLLLGIVAGCSLGFLLFYLLGYLGYIIF